MPEEIATQRTIQWIQEQRIELEARINQITGELDRAKKEYESFTDLLSRLQQPENSSSWDGQKNSHDYSVSISPNQLTDYDIDPINSSNFEDEDEDEIAFEDIDNSIDDEIDDSEDSEEDKSSPKDWLLPKYQNLPMEDVMLEILRQCQPAKPIDVARRIYQISEDDPNFDRARNSANAALTNGKKAGKWKTIKRGVYVLNSFPDYFKTSVS